MWGYIATALVVTIVITGAYEYAIKDLVHRISDFKDLLDEQTELTITFKNVADRQRRHIQQLQDDNLELTYNAPDHQQLVLPFNVVDSVGNGNND